MSDFISQLASLAGIDTLMPASFRGVAFDCLYTRDTLARDTVSYAYPYRDGATVEDQGLKAVNFRLSAILFGDDWKQQLKTLLTAFKTSGPGELIHPIYGSIPRAQFLEAGVEKRVEPIDAVTVELVFIESGEEQALFSAASADQAAESISSTGSGLLDKAASAFSSAMSTIREVENGVERINTIVAEGEYVLDSVRESIQSTVSSVSNLLDTPSALVSDLKGLMSTFSDSLTLVGADVSSDISQATDTLLHSGSTVVSSWKQLTELADTVVSSPSDYVTSRSLTTISKPFRLSLSQTTSVRAEDTELVTRVVRLVAVTEVAEVAATIMQNEEDAPSLTSTQIEDIANDVRQYVVTALSAERSAIENAQNQARAEGVTAGTQNLVDIVNSLQNLAYTIQVQAARLIEVRPPLVSREVLRQSSLHLVAFDWYGDITRADELLRLNPNISNPNDIQPGVFLNAYAR